MKVGMDLDGCPYDFRVSMGLYLLDLGRITQEQFELAGQKEWSLSKAWGIADDEFEELFINGVNAGQVFRYGIPEPGSIEALHRLREKGHTIHVITARVVGEKFAHNTLDWFHEVGLPYDSVHFTGDKTVVSGVDVLFDDHENNYRACTAAGMRVVLIDRPWNRHVAGAPRVTFATIESYVDELDKEIRVSA